MLRVCHCGSVEHWRVRDSQMLDRREHRCRCSLGKLCLEIEDVQPVNVFTLHRWTLIVRFRAHTDIGQLQAMSMADKSP